MGGENKERKRGYRLAKTVIREGPGHMIIALGSVAFFEIFWQYLCSFPILAHSLCAQARSLASIWTFL